jgi:para-nitrobenzyl esterase
MFSPQSAQGGHSADKRATMVFNDQCQIADDPDGEVRPLWSKIATS